MQQNLRHLINQNDLPDDLHEVVSDFLETFRSKAAVALAGDAFSLYDHSLVNENRTPRTFGTDGRTRHREKPTHSQDVLPDEIFLRLKEWWRIHQDQESIAQLLPFVEVMKEISIDGIEYTTSRKRPQDSNVVFHNGSVEDWQAGRIREIFQHTQHQSSQTFLVIDCLQPLTKDHALRDPCRLFPVAGGRYFYRKMMPHPYIVTPGDIIGHFASRDRTLPCGVGITIQEADVEESIECIHILPLDKVSAPRMLHGHNLLISRSGRTSHMSAAISF